MGSNPITHPGRAALIVALCLAQTPATSGCRGKAAGAGGAERDPGIDASASLPAAVDAADAGPPRVLSDLACQVRTPSRVWGGTCRLLVTEPMTFTFTEDLGSDIADWENRTTVEYSPSDPSMPLRASFAGTGGGRGAEPFHASIEFSVSGGKRLARATTRKGGKPESVSSTDLAGGAVIFPFTLFAIGPRLLESTGEISGLTVVRFVRAVMGEDEVAIGKGWKLVREAPAADGGFSMKLYDGAGALEETVTFDADERWVGQEHAPTGVTTSLVQPAAP